MLVKGATDRGNVSSLSSHPQGKWRIYTLIAMIYIYIYMYTYNIYIYIYLINSFVFPWLLYAIQSHYWNTTLQGEQDITHKLMKLVRMILLGYSLFLQYLQCKHTPQPWSYNGKWTKLVLRWFYEWRCVRLFYYPLVLNSTNIYFRWLGCGFSLATHGVTFKNNLRVRVVFFRCEQQEDISIAHR